MEILNTIEIDQNVFPFEQGETILEVAKRNNISIPTMCYFKDLKPEASCMVCVVEKEDSGQLIPSCEHLAQNGMKLKSNSTRLQESRRTALELLLSDHLGDCSAPCQNICPAGMDIPKMNRLAAREDYHGSLKSIKEHIPFPVTLGYICPAPCEKGCRRKQIDQTIPICKIKRKVGEIDLLSNSPWLPNPEKLSSQKAIAIIGAGPAGLSAAWYLRLFGYTVDVFEKETKPFSMIRNNVSEEKLPFELMDKEIELVKRLGVRIHCAKFIDDKAFDNLVDQYDAILLTHGANNQFFGLESGSKGIISNNFHTSKTRVFACGSAIRNLKMAVSAVGQGKNAAERIHAFLVPEKEIKVKEFNSTFGKLKPNEFKPYTSESINHEAVLHTKGWLDEISTHTLKIESERCLHCDCRAKSNCKLQTLSTEYNAKQSHFKSVNRKTITKERQHPEIIFEKEKCIKCGVCIKIAQNHEEPLGLTFIGRGFDVNVGIALNEDISQALLTCGKEVALACPTGAICIK